MKTEHTITTYTIESHPNPEACFEYLRMNWHDLGQFDVDDFLKSFKALGEALGVRVDYCAGIHPSRGEFLTLCGRVSQSDVDALDADEMSLTGMCWDYGLIKALQETDLDQYPDKVDLSHALADLHAQGEFLYSDEGLRELCEANDYQFTKSGKFYPA